MFMKINIYTVMNSAYWKFGQLFIDSLYDKVNLDKINKIYVSDTGLDQEQIEYLKSKKNVVIIDSGETTNFEGGSWSDDWHTVVTSKSMILRNVVKQAEGPVVMIDADCLFIDDITDLIDTEYDLQICQRTHDTAPYLGSFVSINNKDQGIHFINNWMMKIQETAKFDSDGHLIARESPALSKTVKQLAAEVNIQGLPESMVSVTHKGLLKNDSRILHFKGSSKSKTTEELYNKRLKGSTLYKYAKKYLTPNMLFLCNREYYIKKMSRVRFHSMEAVGKKCNLMWWGPGWEGYDNKKTVQENIDLLEDRIDLIITYKPLEMKDMKDVNIPVCLRYNEMYDVEWTKMEIDKSGAEMIICHHENDMQPYIDHYGDKIKFYHIAHCAEKSVFKQYFTPKQYDVLLVGALNANTKLGRHYPLRDRMSQLIWKMPKKYRVGMHQRPFGRQDDAFKNKQAHDFAAAINNTKICITDSGAPNSRFGKYVEIPMCGTVIAGDIPGEDQENFRKFVIEINMNMSDTEIINKLIYYLENEEKLRILKEEGLKWSGGYTQEDYADRFIEASINYLER